MSLENTIEFDVAANDILQIANHELMDANRELISANEFLQSLNNDLNDLHDEDKIKISDLKRKAVDLMSSCSVKLQSTAKKLTEINIELDRSNLDLLQFASVASHDLKEPLRKIQMFANALNARVGSETNIDEVAYIKKIMQSSDRMQLLIEDVLTVSRLSNEKLSLTRIDLFHLVSNILNDNQTKIEEKKAAVTVSPLPDIFGIEGQIHLLFQNLLSNALKFSASEPCIDIREITLEARYAEKYSIAADEYTCIQITDNGIGFEPEYSEKIFGMFQRLYPKEYEGTGIGLAICKKIMEKHKGFILAESSLHNGAKFLVIIPKH